ncbi:recombinase family protein [Sporanaerobium hydrogeniformans]|uniref:recombinase family protein n=1 Tax=Sporanaerobium hydrogeniformans TaxID=3072179 RepID=UPI0026A0ABF3
MDVASGKAGTARKEFARMLEDCKAHKIEIILTKNISRFGRDTVEILEALNQLKVLGVRVIFDGEHLDTANTNTDVIISVTEAIAQAENESRSENIKLGIKQQVADGSSKLYDRKCYGYSHDAGGCLIIDDTEAKNVRLIFDLYLHGKSIIGVVKELEQRGIKSPSGKDKWCKRSIDVMLSLEKYTGTVRLLDSGNHEI